MIERIRGRVPPAPDWVRVGIGDDAAVIEPGRNTLTVLTVDALIEGVHFDPAVCDLADVGFKALAVNLSDLAAMGARPRAAVLSLALPAQMRVYRLDALIDGLLELAGRHGVTLVGGNLAGSPGPLVVDVTALGVVGRRRVLSRSGAKPGDELYVSGRIGAAAAGLGILREHPADAAANAAFREAIQRFRRPEPRVRLGMLVGRNRAASACIDLSDGLADAAHQLAAAGGVGVRIDGPAVPLHPGARRWFEQRGHEPLDAALRGGEDYELLIAVPAKKRRRFTALGRLVKGLPLTRIGVVTREPGVYLTHAGGDRPLPHGFTHF